MFWKKKPAREATPASTGPAGQGGGPRSPRRPPVKGTKIRLFLHPPGRMSRLLEVDLPTGSDLAGAALRCFEPPPEGGAARDDRPGRAWVVELDEETTRQLLECAADIRLLPVGGMGRDGDGANVELTVSAGPAEARLSWWMAAPTGWTAASDLVARLRALSGEEL